MVRAQRISLGLSEEDYASGDMHPKPDKKDARLFCRIGMQVKCNTGAVGLDHSYAPGDIVTVNERNIDHIESLMRGGTMEALSSSFLAAEQTNRIADIEQAKNIGVGKKSSTKKRK